MLNLKREQELLNDGFRKVNATEITVPCRIATVWDEALSTYEVANFDDQEKLEAFMALQTYSMFYFKEFREIKPEPAVVDTVRVGGTGLEDDSDLSYLLDLMSDGSVIWRRA